MHILCLTNGNAVGLGKIREKELNEAAKFWRFKHCTTIDDPRLPDSMKIVWNPNHTAELISQYLHSHPEISTVFLQNKKIDFNI